MISCKDRYLLFSVNRNLYAVELLFVFRITAIDRIYPVPKAKEEYILGTLKAEGVSWTVADLRMKFGEKRPVCLRCSMGILLEYKEDKRCILIDDVRSVIRTDPGKMTPTFGKNSYVLGSMMFEDRIITFLSIDSLFDYDIERLERE